MTDPPKRKPGKQGTTRADRQSLPTCMASSRVGKPCKRQTYRNTRHSGELPDDWFLPSYHEVRLQDAVARDGTVDGHEVTLLYH